MGAGATPVVLTFLLVFVAWRVVFSLNKDLVRARAWGELARRSLPFVAITGMAASLAVVQGSRGAIPIIWALAFGVLLVVARFLSESSDERKAAKAFRRGDHEEAATLYRRLAEERSLARYWTFLGAALGAAERHDEAAQASGRAVELDPDYGLAYYNRALILRKQGRKSRAARDLQRALDADLPRRFRSATQRLLDEMKEK